MSTRLQNSPYSFIMARVLAVVAFAVAAIVCYPEAGVQRFVIAIFGLILVIPGIIWIESCYSVAKYCWPQFMVDSTACVVGSFLFPVAWTPIFIIGLLCVNVPLITPSRLGFHCLIVAHVYLLLGMTASALWHAVPGWQMQVLVVAIHLPVLLVYAHFLAGRILREKRSVDRLEGLAALSRGFAHDFNNLLTGILTNAQLALLCMSDDHESRGSVEAVVDATKQANLVTEQLMIVAGRRRSSGQAIELGRELRTMTRVLRAVVPEFVELQVQTLGQEVEIQTDRTSLNQVLIGLILDAAERAPSPGQVTMSVLGPEQDRMQVVIEVPQAHTGPRGTGWLPRVLTRAGDWLSGSGQLQDQARHELQRQVEQDLAGTLELHTTPESTKTVLYLPTAVNLPFDSPHG